MKKAGLSILAFLLVSLLVACAPQTTTTPQAPAPAPAVAPVPVVPALSAPARAAWEEKWERAVEAAKKEGRLVINSGMTQSGNNALVQRFRESYGIPVEALFGSTSSLVQKILSERRAGLYNFDVGMMGPSGALTLLKPSGALESFDSAFILPDVTDPEVIKKVWWEGKLPWVDADRTYLAAGLRLSFGVAVNTNLVREGEIKSFRDLLNPKWQGKMVTTIPWVGGQSANFVIFAVLFANSELGWDYLTELVRTTKPIVLGDQRQVLDWLSHGKVPVAIAPPPDTIDFILAGAPIKGLVLKEGTWLGGGSQNISMYKHAPHPNAATVFVNWMLTKEGQTILARAGMAESRRLDVPTDHLLPDQVRQPGTKYFLTEQENVVLQQPDINKKTRELFGPLMAQ